MVNLGNDNSRVHWVYVKHYNPNQYETDVMADFFFTAVHVHLTQPSVEWYSVYMTFNRCPLNRTASWKRGLWEELLHFSANE